MASIIGIGVASFKPYKFEYQLSPNYHRKRTAPLDGSDVLLQLNGPAEKRVKYTHDESDYRKLELSVLPYMAEYLPETNSDVVVRLNKPPSPTQQLQHEIAELKRALSEKEAEASRNQAIQEAMSSAYDTKVADLGNANGVIAQKESELCQLREKLGETMASAVKERNQIVSEAKEAIAHEWDLRQGAERERDANSLQIEQFQAQSYSARSDYENVCHQNSLQIQDLQQQLQSEQCHHQQAKNQIQDLQQLLQTEQCHHEQAKNQIQDLQQQLQTEQYHHHQQAKYQCHENSVQVQGLQEKLQFEQYHHQQASVIYNKSQAKICKLHDELKMEQELHQEAKSQRDNNDAKARELDHQCVEKDAEIEQIKEKYAHVEEQLKSYDDVLTEAAREHQAELRQFEDEMAQKDTQYAELLDMYHSVVREKEQLGEALANVGGQSVSHTKMEINDSAGVPAMQPPQSHVAPASIYHPATKAKSMKPAAVSNIRSKKTTERDVLGSGNSKGRSGISKTGGRSGQTSNPRGSKWHASASSARRAEAAQQELDERDEQTMIRDVKGRMNDMLLADTVKLYQEGQFDIMHAKGLAGVQMMNTAETIIQTFSSHKGKRMVAAEIRIEDILPDERKRILPPWKELSKDYDEMELEDYISMCSLAHFPEVHLEAAKVVLEDRWYRRFERRFCLDYGFEKDSNGVRQECMEKENGRGHWDATVDALSELPHFENACRAWVKREPQDGKYCWPPTFTDPKIIGFTSLHPVKDLAEAIKMRKENLPLTTVGDIGELSELLQKTNIKMGTFKDHNISTQRKV